MVNFFFSKNRKLSQISLKCLFFAILPFITFFRAERRCAGCVSALMDWFHPFFCFSSDGFWDIFKKPFHLLLCEIFLAFSLFPNFIKFLQRTLQTLTRCFVFYTFFLKNENFHENLMVFCHILEKIDNVRSKNEKIQGRD